MKFDAKRWWKIFKGEVSNGGRGKEHTLSFCTALDVADLLKLEVESIQKAIEELEKYSETPISFETVKSQYFYGRTNCFNFVKRLFADTMLYMQHTTAFGKADIIHLKKTAIDFRQKELCGSYEKYSDDIKSIAARTKAMLKERQQTVMCLI